MVFVVFVVFVAVGSNIVPDVPNPFDAWLPKVLEDPIHVDEGPSGLHEEARANGWSFGITEEEARSLSADDVLSFLSAVEDARERQLLERFGRARPMVFYCWHSVQTAQINLCLVSPSHGRLPFGAPVEIVDALRGIVDAFLANPHHGGIPMGEFRVATQEDLDASVEPKPHVVRVWSRVLPRDGG